jgi:hypothetical protein
LLKDGNVIIKPKFEQVLGFSEVLACVNINDSKSDSDLKDDDVEEIEKPKHTH